jgi:alpha-1,2-mannosyltransferase
LGRILWIPDLPFIPNKFRREWGRYCLLERKSKQSILEGQKMAPGNRS